MECNTPRCLVATGSGWEESTASLFQMEEFSATRLHDVTAQNIVLYYTVTKQGKKPVSENKIGWLILHNLRNWCGLNALILTPHKVSHWESTITGPQMQDGQQFKCNIFKENIY